MGRLRWLLRLEYFDSHKSKRDKECSVLPLQQGKSRSGSVIVVADAGLQCCRSHSVALEEIGPQCSSSAVALDS